MLDIYVDGDSCPVKNEVIRVATRHGLHVYIVSNSGFRPVNNPKITMIRVEAGADVADDWIAEHVKDGDITITADILLAERCLKQGASVIKPTGTAFTMDNIGSAVAGRNLSAHLRELGVETHHSAFRKQDKSQFLQTLENTIQHIKRRQ